MIYALHVVYSTSWRVNLAHIKWSKFGTVKLYEVQPTIPTAHLLV